MSDMENQGPARPDAAGPARPGSIPSAAPVAPPAAAPVAPPVQGPITPASVAAEFAGPVSAPAASAAGIRVEAGQVQDLDLDALLEGLVTKKGSDLHLSAGSPPLMRINGDMKAVSGFSPLTADSIRKAIYGITKPEQQAMFEKEWELDFAYTLSNGQRFRANIMIQKQNPGAVFRAIPHEIKPLEALGMPPILYNFAGLPRGLVLVTGPTGSGKSTTLASLIDRANRTRSGHILTVEDPIEFLHPHRSCVVNQREVGMDTHSFTTALKHVLRQDPDIILIGELRDLETISIALTAAETGHLVFATLHTQSAKDTVNRVIDVFPSGQQSQIRSQLAATLRGVVCQTLVKRKDGKGRQAAAEIMVVNSAIASMIRRDETHQIDQALQSGGELGMQTLNQHLAELVAKEVIEREAAEEVATDLLDLDTLISGKSRNRAPQMGGGIGGGMSMGDLGGFSTTLPS